MCVPCVACLRLFVRPWALVLPCRPSGSGVPVGALQTPVVFGLSVMLPVEKKISMTDVYIRQVILTVLTHRVCVLRCFRPPATSIEFYRISSILGTLRPLVRNRFGSGGRPCFLTGILKSFVQKHSSENRSD